MNKAFLILIAFLQFLFVLNRCKSKVSIEANNKRSTVVLIDSVSGEFFERAGAMLKYMTDEGIPVAENLTKRARQIIISVDRDYIEVALQDNKTITQYFVLKTKDTTELLTDGENFILRNKNHDRFPYDEIYPNERNSILFKSNKPGIEKFLQMTRLTNSYHIDVTKEGDLNTELFKLKEEAYIDFVKERELLDSLQSDSLISPVVAEFYRLKIDFDNAKIASYNGPSPSFADEAFLAPFELTANSNSKNFNNWRQLTFFDDWIEVHYKSLYGRHRTSRITFSDFERVYNQIEKKALPLEIRKSLLLKNVMNACDLLPSDECKTMIREFSADSNEPRLVNKLTNRYKIFL